jgi:divalent metal cation (Fe/Co/Zn/Cd) transporter
MEQGLASKFGLRFGLYAGAFTLLYGTLGYIIGVKMYTEWWVGIIVWLVTIGILVAGVIQARKQTSKENGFSFKLAFSTFFIAALIAVVAGVLFNILLFHVIDPEFAIVVEEATLDVAIGMMEKFGTPQDVIDEEVDKMLDQNLFSIKNQILGLPKALIFYAIVGLIVAASTKRKPDLFNA